jgi:hypothetical protein
MNGTYRNGAGHAGIPPSAMVPATWGPVASYGACCPETYAAEQSSMMCDVCDLLQDICNTVTDTNKMVKTIYKKVIRDTEGASNEAKGK